MDKDKKITLSLFLTWIVFGLFNLFGQPQAFVPPIIIDGLMIFGLGIYFLSPVRKNFYYPLLIFFPLLVLSTTVIELNWINAGPNIWYAGFILSVLIALTFLLATLQMFKINLFHGMVSSFIGIIFSISIFHSFFMILPEKNTPLILYFSGGIICLLIQFTIRSNDTIFQSYKRLSLLLLLNVFFDMGNYFALMLLR